MDQRVSEGIGAIGVVGADQSGSEGIGVVGEGGG